MYVLVSRSLPLQVSYRDRTEREMDTDKASHEDNSFPILPKWASYHGSQPSSQNRKHILKPILTVLLLGLLALSTYQVIRGASSPNVGDHSAHSMELHGNLKLSLGDMFPSVADDGNWVYNAYPEEHCVGKVAPKAGSFFAACQQINLNETYTSVSVPLLPSNLRICLYPDQTCSGNATAITTVTGCAPANATYYVVKPVLEDC